MKKDIWLTSLARIFTMAFASACSIISSRLFFLEGGIDLYTFSTLLSSLSIVATLLGWGIGASVTNFISQHPISDFKSGTETKFLTAFRLLVFSSILLFCVALFMYSQRNLTFFLGGSIFSGLNANRSIFIALLLISIGLPFSTGHSILVGLNKNYISTLCIGSAAPVGLIWILACRQLGIDREIGALAPNVGSFFSIIIAWVVVKKWNLNPVQNFWSKAFHPKRFPGKSIRKTTVPLGLILVTLTLTLQADKLILSHVANNLEVARYSLMAQLLSPVHSLMGVIATSYWPYLTRMRSSGLSTYKLLRQGLKVVALGTIFLILITYIFSSYLFEFISQDQILFDFGLFFLFSLVILILVLHSTLSSAITNESDLKFQSVLITSMAIVNLAISWILGERIGASGPLIATILTLPLMVMVPNVMRARRLL